MGTKFLAFIGLMLFLCVVVTTGLSDLSARLDSWDYMGTVPATPEELFSKYYGYDGSIYVLTSNDEMFLCRLDAQTCVIDVEDKTFDQFFTSDKNDSLTPLAPGTVVAAFTTMESFGDTVLKRHFIALNDGRIWTWHRDPFQNMAIKLNVCGTTLMIILAGTVVFLFSLSSRSRSRQKVKNYTKHA
jgi:hypothetical protein